MLNADTETTQVFPFVTKDSNSFHLFWIKIAIKNDKRAAEFLHSLASLLSRSETFLPFWGNDEALWK